MNYFIILFYIYIYIDLNLFKLKLMFYIYITVNKKIKLIENYNLLKFLYVQMKLIKE